MVKKMKSPRRLIALAVFAIIAMSAFGFAAVNTIADGGKAGDGYGGDFRIRRHERPLHAEEWERRTRDRDVSLSTRPPTA